MGNFLALAARAVAWARQNQTREDLPRDVLSAPTPKHLSAESFCCREPALPDRVLVVPFWVCQSLKFSPEPYASYSELCVAVESGEAGFRAMEFQVSHLWKKPCEDVSFLVETVFSMSPKPLEEHVTAAFESIDSWIE